MDEINKESVPKKLGNILVVDDSEITHELLRAYLEPIGYSVDSAYDGIKALAMLDNNYDLIILDFNMPNMDGIQILKQIKEKKESAPVFMLTAYPSIDNANMSINLGARSFFTKPIENMNDFIRNVHEAVYLAQITRDNRSLYDSMMTGQVDSFVIDGKVQMMAYLAEENQDILRVLLQLSKNAIIILDGDGIIKYCNIMFLQLVGDSFKNVLGNSFDSYIPEYDTERVIGALTKISHFEIINNLNTGLKTRLGRVLSLKIDASPIIHNSKFIGTAMIISDLTELTKAKKKVELFSYLVENAKSDIIFILKPDGQIIDCNNLANSKFGSSKDEMLSKNIKSFFKEKSEEIWYTIGKNIAKTLNWTGEIQMININGEEFPVETSISKSVVINNIIIEDMICFMRDITERKKSEQMFGEIQRLNVLNQEKSEFMSRVSHELITPLNAIMGYSEVLKEELKGTSNDVQESADNILKSSRHLLDLINDILDLSRAERETLELVIENISIPEIIEDTIRIIKDFAYNKNIIIKQDLDKEMDYIEADKKRLKQILINLCANAIKYSKSEGGIVTIKTRKNGNMVEFSISDTGIGIKDEDLNKLFITFKQIDSKLSRKYQGAGIRLAFTKHLVELHNGKIWANSIFGEGSTFAFTLPLKAKTKN